MSETPQVLTRWQRATLKNSNDDTFEGYARLLSEGSPAVAFVPFAEMFDPYHSAIFTDVDSVSITTDPTFFTASYMRVDEYCQQQGEHIKAIFAGDLEVTSVIQHDSHRYEVFFTHPATGKSGSINHPRQALLLVYMPLEARFTQLLDQAMQLQKDMSEAGQPDNRVLKGVIMMFHSQQGSRCVNLASACWEIATQKFAEGDLVRSRATGAVYTVVGLYDGGAALVLQAGVDHSPFPAYDYLGMYEKVQKAD